MNSLSGRSDTVRDGVVECGRCSETYKSTDRRVAHTAGVAGPCPHCWSSTYAEGSTCTLVYTRDRLGIVTWRDSNDRHARKLVLTELPLDLSVCLQFYLQHCATTRRANGLPHANSYIVFTGALGGRWGKKKGCTVARCMRTFSAGVLGLPPATLRVMGLSSNDEGRQYVQQMKHVWLAERVSVHREAHTPGDLPARVADDLLYASIGSGADGKYYMSVDTIRSSLDASDELSRTVVGATQHPRSTRPPARRCADTKTLDRVCRYITSGMAASYEQGLRNSPAHLVPWTRCTPLLTDERFSRYVMATLVQTVIHSSVFSLCEQKKKYVTKVDHGRPSVQTRSRRGSLAGVGGR